MTVHYIRYRGSFLEIFFTDDGRCYASCEHPLTLGVIESEVSESPKQAFDKLKAKIDLIYADYTDDLGQAV